MTSAPGGRARPPLRWLPPQHGAWAMLLVPFAAGMLHARSWVLVPLLLAWLAGYLASYFALQAVKTRRVRRVLPQLPVYAGVAAASAAVVVGARPAVLACAPAFAVLIAVTWWYARRRRDRALGSDAASVLQACLMVLVVQTAAGAAVGPALGTFLACLLYFAGTVLYVKTVIRERGDRRYLAASLAFHAVAVVASAALSPWLVPVFGWFLLRAAVLPGRGPAVRRVGLIEVVGSIALLLSLAAAQG